MSDERPRLRAIEAFPMEHEGQEMVVLRDPAGYTEAVLMLPMGVVGIVALFDGSRSLVEVQAEIMREHAELVPRSQLEQMVATLDEHGFMDSARFAERRATIDGEFLNGPLRAAAHAGGAYAADPHELRAAMDAFFTAPQGPGPAAAPASGAPPIRAIIAPHIDFHRGGPAYAWAYRDLIERADADTFVIFGTCHAGMKHPFALTRKDYDTPFGPARVDRDLVEKLAGRARQDCFGSELAHRSEHSIEFQAVFLQYLYAGRRDIRIVPVLASFAHEVLARRQGPADDPRVSAFLDALAETLAASGRSTAVIAGADLAHVGPRFGDPEPVSPAERARIEREDRAMLAAVEAGDAGGFFASVAADGDRRRICGLSPIYALLRTVAGTPGTLRHYGQSDDPQGVVSYASVVF
jgi:AmmeMemoRadiSam system protein B